SARLHERRDTVCARREGLLSNVWIWQLHLPRHRARGCAVAKYAAPVATPAFTGGQRAISTGGFELFASMAVAFLSGAHGHRRGNGTFRIHAGRSFGAAAASLEILVDGAGRRLFDRQARSILPALP